MNFIKKLVLVSSLLISNTVMGGWNGAGEIKSMYIYPTYAVIVQGNTEAGPANCENDGTWSFSWSQFDQPTQNRIQSMLLSAYVSKTRIQVVIDGNNCGPENKKLFNGKIQLP